MTFLFALLIWILILSLVFSIAMYAVRQLDAPFQRWGVIVVCIIAIVVLLGFVSGGIPLFGFEHVRRG